MCRYKLFPTLNTFFHFLHTLTLERHVIQFFEAIRCAELLLCILCFEVNDFDSVCDDVSCVNLCAVLFIAACLNMTFNLNSAALTCRPFLKCFSCLTECDAVRIICTLACAVLILAAIQCNAESCNCCLILWISDFDVLCDSAWNNNLVRSVFPFYK